MDALLSWVLDNILAIVAVALTIVLVYHYLIERETVVKLSKRYRDSIFEAQSKIFLNATQYLISGNRDLAIREFLNAVDLNRETIDTYFALGGLFRSNGEIEKAISIHRSLIARDHISEATRLRSLKELAKDFDKGGFVDKAVETYKDVLKINRDQHDTIEALCLIYENIEDWEQAHSYRLMLSKVGQNNQSETISHILVQKAKVLFENGQFAKCQEELSEALRYAPSVSAKILWLRLSLMNGNMERAQNLLVELINEHPMYITYVFVSLEEGFHGDDKVKQDYQTRMKVLKRYFLDIKGLDISSSSVVLAKVRLFKEAGEEVEAYQLIKNWMADNPSSSKVLMVEYIKLLIDLKKNEEVVNHTKSLLDSLHQSHTRHYCEQCGYNSDDIFWRCPQCYEWETIKFRWKV
ncbi:MAG: hypothetical protein ISR65_05110 [Bacteriovoracaceae bacterium]|nr:hypothetical protein [Bacteriovoracaceae bacterium]